MNKKSKIRNNKKSYYQASAVIFILFIGIFVGANLITKDKTYSETENRILATKPNFTIDRLLEGRFTSKFEDYVVDQFIGRDFFTNIKMSVDKLLGRNQANGVFLGKDGYLIEDFTAPNEEAVNQNLQAIDNFAKRYKDVKQYMLISPTSVGILKDKLPYSAPVIDQESYLKSYKEKLPSSIKFVDTYETLNNHKDEYIFYKTDHHWTSLGAFYSYEKLAEDMGLKKKPDDYYNVQLVSNDFFGALSSKSGYDVEEGDKVQVYIPAKNEEYVVVNYVEEQRKISIFI